MKALYIGYNSTYINDQKDLILSVFRRITDLTFYGPGYTNSNELKLGLEKWLLSQPDYQILILDPGFVSYDEKLKPEYYIKYFKNSTNDILHFDPKEISKHAKKYQEFFIESSAHKFTFTTWDPYDISDKILNFLVKSNTYILDIFGDKLSEYINQLKYNSKFNNFFKSSFNDNWIKFEEKYRHKIISFPHAIFSSYFSYLPLDRRRNKFSIIGVLYPERKEVISVLSFNLRFILFIKRIIEFLKYKFKIKTNYSQLMNRKYKYQNLIERSKFSFVSGSPLRYPVRKYFEVPAKGSISIGWTCNGFKNLGFVNGENFLIAEDKETLLKYLNIKDSKKLQKIANNARKLVFDKHSDYARIAQLSESLNLIINDKFNGSYWENGEYKHY